MKILNHKVTQAQKDKKHLLSHTWMLASDFMCVFVGERVQEGSLEEKGKDDKRCDIKGEKRILEAEGFK